MGVTQFILPLLYSALSVGVFFFAATWSTPWRITCLPALLLLAYASLISASNWPSDWGSLWGLFICIWILHSTSLLLLEDASIWNEKYLSSTNFAYLVPKKYHAPLALWNNPRLLRASDVVQLPREDMTREPANLKRFAISRLGKLIAYWLIDTYLVNHISPGLFLPLQIEDFDPVRQVFFRRLISISDSEPVTLREVFMRAVFVPWWLYSSVSRLDAVHAALSFVAVIILQCDPHTMWPPLFGSLKDSYSMRRFWSRFWHRLHVSSYGSYSRFLSRNVLGLKRESVWDRSVVIAAMYLLSGAVHAVVSWHFGDACSWPSDVWWFCVNFGATAIETVVMQLVQSFADSIKQRARLEKWKQSEWSKILGYLWVYVFLFWSVPKWQYSKINCRILAHVREMGDGIME